MHKLLQKKSYITVVLCFRGLFKIVYLTPEFVEADVGYTLLDQISSLVGKQSRQFLKFFKHLQ